MCVSKPRLSVQMITDLVNCRLVSDLSNSEGVVFGEREHHEAVVRLVKKSDDLSGFLQSEITKLPSIGTSTGTT